MKATRKTESQKRAEERAKNWATGRCSDVCEPSEPMPTDEDEALYFAWLRIASFEGRGSGVGFWRRPLGELLLLCGARFCRARRRRGGDFVDSGARVSVRRLLDVGLSGA
ncbi:MAG: hypothetical protein IJ387_10775 [Thermoguttaceae bacterium]|nr:hypothetical protein [Thermoguttaceae bacterium]